MLPLIPISRSLCVRGLWLQTLPQASNSQLGGGRCWPFPCNSSLTPQDARNLWHVLLNMNKLEWQKDMFTAPAGTALVPGVQVPPVSHTSISSHAHLQTLSNVQPCLHMPIPNCAATRAQTRVCPSHAHLWTVVCTDLPVCAQTNFFCTDTCACSATHPPPVDTHPCSSTRIPTALHTQVHTHSL